MDAAVLHAVDFEARALGVVDHEAQGAARVRAVELGEEVVRLANARNNLSIDRLDEIPDDMRPV